MVYNLHWTLLFLIITIGQTLGQERSTEVDKYDSAWPTPPPAPVGWTNPPVGWPTPKDRKAKTWGTSSDWINPPVGRNGGWPTPKDRKAKTWGTSSDWINPPVGRRGGWPTPKDRKAKT